MQFYYKADKQSICDDIDFLAESTSASYPILGKLRNVNNAYDDYSRLIWSVADDWDFQDQNQSGYPRVLRTMGHLSANYLIPTNAFDIKQVEVKDSANNWIKLTHKDYHELTISPEEYLETGGTPMYYGLDGNELRLYPPPHSGYATLTNGLLVRLASAATPFTSAATTSPGFVRPFHRLLSYSGAIDFVNDESKRRILLLARDRLEKGLITFYSHRLKESPAKLFPKSKRRWRQYL